MLVGLLLKRCLYGIKARRMIGNSINRFLLSGIMLYWGSNPVTSLNCFFPQVNDQVGKFKYLNCADGAHVCLICLFVMAIVWALFLFLDQGRPSLVDLCHHGHRFTFKNGRIVYLDVSWVLSIAYYNLVCRF